MKSARSTNGPELAFDWYIPKLEGHLKAGDKDALVEFVSQRYEERSSPQFGFSDRLFDTREDLVLRL